MQTRRRPVHPRRPLTRLEAALVPSLVSALTLTLTLACVQPQAVAQDDPAGPVNAAAQAREDYQRCLDLKALGRYCTALEACEEGLGHHPTNAALKGLTEDLRKRCEAEERRPMCGFGQVASARTGWNCCWPGQTWDGTRCDGAPTRCDVHFDLDEVGQRCVPKRCEEGQYHVDGVHCCWPGQRWSRSRELCIYQPRCPDGFELHNGTTCRVAASCPPGQARVDSVHCCWPGQRWSNGTRACAGTPKCPPDTTPNDANGCSPAP